ncbi:YggS family pyridoxal phosphate-dependent enzyme [Dermatophilus congolensis]|uniref:YggS family pyridoxal phosphate-dependent enzyme n=1 Tax=Dermatophilus congolensis TaxID=1863 RepID=UPI00312C9F9F
MSKAAAMGEGLEGALVERECELRRNLEIVRGRIESACVRSGRSVDSVQLVVVTKFFPATDVAALVGCGVTDVGESRDQEAVAKVGEVARLCGEISLPRWHFVGQVQSKKAVSIARYADVVQSVDRPKLVTALAGAASRAGRRLDVLLQVDLRSSEAISEDPGRGGVPPAELARLADFVMQHKDLRLRGLMSVAPRNVEPAAAFAELFCARERFLCNHPSATWLSAGMSGDFEEAIQAGATHVRVGSAILGSRSTYG